MARITGSGAGNFKLLKQMKEFLDNVSSSQGTLTEQQEKIIKAIKEITDK